MKKIKLLALIAFFVVVPSIANADGIDTGSIAGGCSVVGTSPDNRLVEITLNVANSSPLRRVYLKYSGTNHAVASVLCTAAMLNRIVDIEYVGNGTPMSMGEITSAAIH